MKIYVTHSTAFDFKAELYQPLRSSKLNQDHEIILPHENSAKQYSSKDLMPELDLVVAEVSYPSTGQGIELGWADAVGVPILAVYKIGTKPSRSIKTVALKIHEYEGASAMIAIVAQFLTQL